MEYDAGSMDGVTASSWQARRHQERVGASLCSDDADRLWDLGGGFFRYS